MNMQKDKKINKGIYILEEALQTLMTLCQGQ